MLLTDRQTNNQSENITSSAEIIIYNAWRLAGDAGFTQPARSLDSYDVTGVQFSHGGPDLHFAPAAV